MATKIPGRAMLAAVLLVVAAAAEGATSLDVTGSYSFTLGATNLSPANTAGADYAVHTTSTFILLDVKSKNSWRLDVKRGIAAPPNGLPPHSVIRIQRQGTTSWLTLDDTGGWQPLYTGSGNLKTHYLLEITVSADDTSAMTYTNPIDFRVVDTGP